MTADARHFLTAFGIVSLLLVTLTGALVARVAAVGEVLSIDEGAALRGTLFADYAAYKREITVRRKPELLVLGSSRVMAVRGQLFSECVARGCFYNAGGGMPELKTGLTFFREIAAAGAAPRVLLLGVDFWDFNGRFSLVRDDVAEPVRREGLDGLRYAVSVSYETAKRSLGDRAVRDLLVGASGVPPATAGIAALVNGSGFRPDGSYVYSRADMTKLSGSPGIDPVGYATSAKRCGYHFECFDRLDPRAIGYLEGLLALAARHGTMVILWTPAMADEVAVALREAQPAVLPEVERVVSAAAGRHGFPFVAVRSVAELGCAADEIFDGLHPSEVCDARLVLRLLADAGAGAVLSRYTSAEHVRALIERRASGLLLVGEP